MRRVFELRSYGAVRSSSANGVEVCWIESRFRPLVTGAIKEIECQIGQDPWTISAIERVCSMVLSGILCHHEVLLAVVLRPPMYLLPNKQNMKNRFRNALNRDRQRLDSRANTNYVLLRPKDGIPTLLMHMEYVCLQELGKKKGRLTWQYAVIITEYRVLWG